MRLTFARLRLRWRVKPRWRRKSQPVLHHPQSPVRHPLSRMVKRLVRGRLHRNLRPTPRCILFLPFRLCRRHRRQRPRADRILRLFPTRQLRQHQRLRASPFRRPLTGSRASPAIRAAQTPGRWRQISLRKVRYFLFHACRAHPFQASHKQKLHNQVCLRLSQYWAPFHRRVRLHRRRMCRSQSPAHATPARLNRSFRLQANRWTQGKRHTVFRRRIFHQRARCFLFLEYRAHNLLPVFLLCHRHYRRRFLRKTICETQLRFPVRRQLRRTLPAVLGAPTLSRQILPRRRRGRLSPSSSARIWLRRHLAPRSGLSIRG